MRQHFPISLSSSVRLSGDLAGQLYSFPEFCLLLPPKSHFNILPEHKLRVFDAGLFNVRAARDNGFLDLQAA